jgi:crossover junction endodeoxyribonuclease RuvC
MPDLPGERRQRFTTIVLGIDPGTITTGYGVVGRMGSGMSILACGAIRNTPRTPMPARLKRIHKELSSVIKIHRPTECAIETAFYGKNAQSALKLGHARGVSLLVAAEHEIPTAEYSPREVKKAVVGKGNASKEQVQFMVKALLGQTTSHMMLDASDALAVAICHLHRCTVPDPLGKDWKAYVDAHPERVKR